MNVSLPNGLKNWAEARVAEGRYSSTSDYVRNLMQRDQGAEEKKQALRTATDLGRGSGSGQRSLTDIVAKGRRRRAKA
ncbi:type II toxin-antitoxin system ParD family antitoxin [Sphingomonas alpina]|uniref:Type II toxin-antitoxin system ParD family antitoxin n=2 Tax=Sphingomonas alpina TaxID=653931 RepID=A0A7H0LR58_9SPHN|nr:type II toxin-antitoxin system ParD family antitoxin [Sphingomonas alpina]